MYIIVELAGGERVDLVGGSSCGCFSSFWGLGFCYHFRCFSFQGILDFRIWILVGILCNINASELVFVKVVVCKMRHNYVDQCIQTCTRLPSHLLFFGHMMVVT